MWISAWKNPEKKAMANAVSVDPLEKILPFG